jgi:hypothetical protein
MLQSAGYAVAARATRNLGAAYATTAKVLRRDPVANQRGFAGRPERLAEVHVGWWRVVGFLCWHRSIEALSDPLGDGPFVIKHGVAGIEIRSAGGRTRVVAR